MPNDIKYETLEAVHGALGAGTAAFYDAILDGEVAVAALQQVNLSDLGMHRLARAVEALAKQPTLLPLSPVVAGTKEIIPDPATAWAIPMSVRCQHCNARGETVAKVKHSPNCPVLKGK